MKDENVIKRFFDKIDKEDCWNWNGALRNGYGVLKVNKKVMGAHRLSWVIHFGDIPDGVLVCHNCDNRKCVNPEHLFLGTHSGNMIDAMNKGRLFIPKGQVFKLNHYPKNTKIQKEKAIMVKMAVINRGNKTLKSISEELNVPYQYVRDISCGRILQEY